MVKVLSGRCSYKASILLAAGAIFSGFVLLLLHAALKVLIMRSATAEQSTAGRVVNSQNFMTAVVAHARGEVKEMLNEEVVSAQARALCCSSIILRLSIYSALFASS